MQTRPSSTLRTVSASAGIFVVSLTASCDKPHEALTAPSSRGLSTAKALAVHGSNRPRREEQGQLALAEVEPSTAGYYYDTTKHQFVVQVSDSTRIGPAIAAAQQLRTAANLAPPRQYWSRPVVAHRVEFSFQQLSDWRDLVVDSLLGRDGVIMDDLDEVRNRVVIGIDQTEASTADRATARLTALGVPLRAVILLQMSLSEPTVLAASRKPPLTATTINSKNDTLGGGFQIENVAADGCSSGVVADRAGVRGFITAAHCTETMWHLDGDTIFFPLFAPLGVAAGHETVDPAPQTCSFFMMFECDDKRPSDAAFIALSYPSRRGAIARTGFAGTTGAGSFTINTAHPWFNVNADQPFVFVGMTVQKVGERTGWTTGTISATCVDHTFPENGKQHLVFCDDDASIYVGKGDSGGPYFTWDGQDGGSFLGLQSSIPGSCPGDFCTTGEFTPYSQIVQDLGTLTVSSEITVGTPSVTASLTGSGPFFSWSAVTTMNTNGAATHYHVLRSVWDASTYTWSEQNTDLTDLTTNFSFTDSGLSFTPSAYVGQTQPADCTYTYAVYWVSAYNSGIWSTPSALQYFQGPADGANPGGRECQSGL